MIPLRHVRAPRWDDHDASSEYYDIEDFLRLTAVNVAVCTVQGLKRRTNDLADLAPEPRTAVELLLRAVWDQLEA